MSHLDAAPAQASPPVRLDAARGLEGYFRVEQDAAGRWWLVRPDAGAIFLKAVHGVRNAEPQRDGDLPADSAVRLRTWGFNAVVGRDGSDGREDGFPFIASAEFCDAGPQVQAPGVRLPDVFDPDWKRRAHAHAARVCAPLIGCRELLGWVTDDNAAWAQPSLAGRPSLLQLCLSLEPSTAAYHAAWEFVLALHGGRIESLSRAWGVRLPNKEVVRELTRAEEGFGTRGYLRDETRWTREFARRYFVEASAAIRAADPNHLVLGCRFASPVGPHVLAECTYPAIDVALPDWRDVLASVERAPVNPVLAGNVNWTTPEFLKLPTAARLLRLTSVEWMLRRGRAALERLARQPAVVGYVWGAWQDQSVDQPPFGGGLVHVNGTEAREHTELLAQFNARAETLRRGSSPPPSP